MSGLRRNLGGGVAGAVFAILVAAAACTSAAVRLTQEGTQLLERGDVATAEQRLEAALKADPNDALAVYWLGQAAERRGDYYAARDWYRRAATRAKDRTMRAAGEDVLISARALAELERVGRVIATLEGQAPEPPGSVSSAPP